MGWNYSSKRCEDEKSHDAWVRSAQGLNDPVRIRILEILSHKQMTAEEIAKVTWTPWLQKGHYHNQAPPWHFEACRVD